MIASQVHTHTQPYICHRSYHDTYTQTLYFFLQKSNLKHTKHRKKLKKQQTKAQNQTNKQIQSQQIRISRFFFFFWAPLFDEKKTKRRLGSRSDATAKRCRTVSNFAPRSASFSTVFAHRVSLNLLPQWLNDLKPFLGWFSH